ncbi:MAG: c-type cytochrome [Isosphaeraceae bacterium]
MKGRTGRHPRPCPGQPGRRAAAAALLVLGLGLSGCREAMYEQPRYEPLEASTFFEDGLSSRPLVAGTVPRDDPRGAPPAGADEDVFYTGWNKGRLAEEVPFKVDRELLVRGKERFGIYCTPCHGLSGDGRGVIVHRGFPQPPPYYNAELRKQPIGHFFDVITRGYGVMYSYASRIKPKDRWAIAAYIRVLQLSQHAEAASLPESDRNKLTSGGASAGRKQP